MTAMVPPTREMDNDTFIKHMNARHLGLPLANHFDAVYGLETLWRSWHMQDHIHFPDDLDHEHRTEPKNG